MKTIVSMVVAFVLLFGVACRADVNEPMRNLAKEMVDRIQKAGLKDVGVPEFTNGSGSLGGKTGSAGRYFAEQMEEYLTESSQGFEVVERNDLNKVLKEAKIQASGITNSASSQAILGKVKGIDSLILGNITRIGSKAKISCKLIQLPSASNKGMKSTEITLDADMLSLFGDTVIVPANTSPTQQVVVAQALNTNINIATSVKSSDYGVRVWVNGKQKPLYKKDGALWVPFKNGEEYELEIYNNSGKRVGVALHIDGLNTIAQKRELPSQGRLWVLDANQYGMIKGWQMDDNVAKKFLVTVSGESVAARQSYTDNIGLITATFFPDASKPIIEDGDEGSRGIVKEMGTGEGDEISSRVKTVQFEAGPVPLAIISLHYDSDELVRKYQKVQ